MSNRFVESSAPSTTAIPKIQNIFGVSEDFLGQLKTWLEQNPPTIPITQIVGFSQFTAQAATPIATLESTTSGTYGDLTTPGPTLTNLPDGQYLFLYGSRAVGSATGPSAARMAIQVNSTAASDTEAGSNANAGQVSITMVTTKTLSGGGSNTVTAKYRSTGGGSCTFEARWLIALRFSN